MKIYGRLLDSKITYAPIPFIVNGQTVDNDDYCTYNQYGWFEVIFVQAPQITQYGYTETWRFIDNKCIQQWEMVLPDTYSPRLARRCAYEFTNMIEWENTNIYTVDEANIRYLEYIAEGETEKAEVLSIKIKEAKDKIREKYPDEN